MESCFPITLFPSSLLFTARLPGQASFLASLSLYSPPHGSGVLSRLSPSALPSRARRPSLPLFLFTARPFSGQASSLLSPFSFLLFHLFTSLPSLTSHPFTPSPLLHCHPSSLLTLLLTPPLLFTAPPRVRLRFLNPSDRGSRGFRRARWLRWTDGPSP